MKTNVLVIVALLLGSMAATAQTWLEKGLNGSSIANPPGATSPDAYAEPEDTTWRRGNVGIGLPGWPKTKLHVGSNYDASDELSSFLGGYGMAHSDITTISMNNGTGSNTDFTLGVLGFAVDTLADSDERTTGILGIALSPDGTTAAELTGVRGVCIGDDLTDQMVGAAGLATGEGNSEVYGVHGTANGSYNLNNAFNYGVHGQTEGDPNSENCGVHGQSIESADINYGVWGFACNATSLNVGVFGLACDTNNGIDYAGYFDGDVLTTSNDYYISDKRLKKNIKRLESGLEGLRKIPVYSYNFKQFDGLNLPNSSRVQYGPLAQELEKVFPEFVIDTRSPFINNDTDVIEFKAVNYVALIPILMRAVQELDEKVAALEKENARLGGDKEPTDDASSATNDVLGITQTSAGASMTLMPNPSNDVMTIAVDRGQCNNCMLVITDLQGKKVATVMLSSSGRQTVSKSEVGEGVFLCNLIVDGKPVSVERMVFL